MKEFGLESPQCRVWDTHRAYLEKVKFGLESLTQERDSLGWKALSVWAGKPLVFGLDSPR